jgi:hypothetical protein
MKAQGHFFEQSWTKIEDTDQDIAHLIADSL